MKERPDPETRRRPRARNRQLAALTSGFVGALALATSFYNVYLQRRQIEAQVWPHLEWTYSYKGDGDDLTFNLANTGVGPARIQGVRVTIDGKPVKTWHEAFDLLASGDPALADLMKDHDIESNKSTVRGKVLGPGAQLAALEFHRAPNDGGARRDLVPLVNAYMRTRVEICYCSTLDDCELLRAGERVSKCALEPPGFEE